MQTAAYIITQALRIFGIIDQTEQPTATDIANNVIVLNYLLRSEQADGAAQYFISLVNATLPVGTAGQIYTFSIGIANVNYLVQKDAVGIRQLWMNDISTVVNREVRPAPKTDVVRTMQLGIITKMHQERQSDGSVLVTAWQAPRAVATALIEIGGRVPPIVAADGSDFVAMPDEGIRDTVLLLGRQIYASYGKNPQAIATQLQDAEAVNRRWRDWARGQQWMRFVRA